MYILPNISFSTKSIICNGLKYDKILVDAIIEKASHPLINNIAIDCFAGLGGVTAGFQEAPGWMVIACINHWPKAIKTHKANFPCCLHMQEDFKVADLGILIYMVGEIRKRNPRIMVHVHFSLECTNFSNAKGGMSRDADSRTLADFTDRYVMALNPEVMWVENVREFTIWGPMIPKVISYSNNRNNKVKKQAIYVPKTANSNDYYNLLIENGHIITCPLVIKKEKTKKNRKTKQIEIVQHNEVNAWMVPDPNFKAEDFIRWKNYMCSFGYNCEYKLLNCADYGVPQHRIRLIMNFVKSGLPITWPRPTHSKTGKGGLPKWLPVRDCLELDNEGTDVLSFDELKTGLNKGQLVPRIESPKTIDRLISGWYKQGPKGDKQFLIQAYSGDPDSKNFSIDNVSRTITATGGNISLATTHLIDYYFGNGFTKPISEPANVVGTKDGAALHTLQFLSDYHSSSDSNSLDRSSPALTSKDKYPLVSTKYIDCQFSTGQQNKSIDDASAALVGHPKQKLVDITHFIMDTQFNNQTYSPQETARTITANRKHYYLVNFQWFNQTLSTIENPSNTIIARLDKSPNYLVVLETGELAIEIYDHDPEHYVKFKKFMAANGIISAKMRMLMEEELLKIMTLEGHKLIASGTDNKKMIGNAVPKKLITALAKAFDEGINDLSYKQKTA